RGDPRLTGPSPGTTPPNLVSRGHVWGTVPPALHGRGHSRQVDSRLPAGDPDRSPAPWPARTCRGDCPPCLFGRWLKWVRAALASGPVVVPLSPPRKARYVVVQVVLAEQLEHGLWRCVRLGEHCRAGLLQDLQLRELRHLRSHVDVLDRAL